MCYAARNALALLELLLPMEKWKREQLIPVLEQLREYLAELLMLRSGLGTPDDTQKKILQGRTGAELLAAANNLQTAIDDLNANVGAGAVIGWLSRDLRQTGERMEEIRNPGQELPEAEAAQAAEVEAVLPAEETAEASAQAEAAAEAETVQIP